MQEIISNMSLIDILVVLYLLIWGVVYGMTNTIKKFVAAITLRRITQNTFGKLGDALWVLSSIYTVVYIFNAGS